MNRITALSIVVLAVLWAATPARAAGAPPGYKTFTSRTNHYQIVYPAAWQGKANSTGQQFFYGSRVAGFKTNVNVYIVSGQKSMSLDTLGKAIAQADRNAGARVSSLASGRAGSLPARIIVGSFKKKISGHIVTDRFATAAFSARRLIWEITYSAAPSAFSSTYVVFTTMLASFSLTK